MSSVCTKDDKMNDTYKLKKLPRFSEFPTYSNA